MLNKKTISPVVATALLLVVAVIAVVGFQNWFQTYSSSVFTDTEQQSSIDTLINLEKIIGDSLYIKSGSKNTLSMFKIVDSNGNLMCKIKDNDINNLQTNTRLLFDFDDNLATDYSGYKNNGTLMNGVDCTVIGINGNACDFDGVDDTIDVTALDITNNRESITISAWINVDTLAVTNSFFAASINNGGTPSSTSRIQISIDTTGEILLVARSTDGGSKSDFRSTSILSTNRWYHIVGIIDYKNDFGKIFIDGIEDTVTRSDLMSFDASSTPATNSTSSAIGTEDDGSASNQFDGTIDEIAIYSKTLTSDEVKVLYDIKKAKLYEQLLPKGIKEIDTSNCNLIKGEVYDVILFTDKQIVEQTIIKN